MMVFKEEDPFSQGIHGSRPSLIRTMCDTLKWCSRVRVCALEKSLNELFMCTVHIVISD